MIKCQHPFSLWNIVAVVYARWYLHSVQLNLPLLSQHSFPVVPVIPFPLSLISILSLVLLSYIIQHFIDSLFSPCPFLVFTSFRYNPLPALSRGGGPPILVIGLTSRARWNGYYGLEFSILSCQSCKVKKREEEEHYAEWVNSGRHQDGKYFVGKVDIMFVDFKKETPKCLKTVYTKLGNHIFFCEIYLLLLRNLKTAIVISSWARREEK